jgi:hypothetical protein
MPLKNTVFENAMGPLKKFIEENNQQCCSPEKYGDEAGQYHSMAAFFTIISQ